MIDKRKKLADVFRQAMKQKGITYQSLGEILGTGKGNAYQIINSQNLTFEKLIEVSEILGVEVDFSLPD